MTDPKLNGWNEWAHRVLGDIERLEGKQDELLKALTLVAIDIAVLKTKAALIGGVWGAVVSAVITVVLSILFKGSIK
jgi:hypothetical protein